MRKGLNPPLSDFRHIHLCVIDQSDCVEYVKKIARFIHCIRKSYFSIEKNINGRSCKNSFSYVSIINYERHHDYCYNMSTSPDVPLPEDGGISMFKAYDALEKAHLLCYYDCKSKLMDNSRSNRRNAVQQHVITSYCYIIVDISNKIKASMIKTCGKDL